MRSKHRRPQIHGDAEVSEADQQHDPADHPGDHHRDQHYLHRELFQGKLSPHAERHEECEQRCDRCAHDAERKTVGECAQQVAVADDETVPFEGDPPQRQSDNWRVIKR